MRVDFIFRKTQGPCDKLPDCRATRSNSNSTIIVYEEDQEDGETGGRLPKIGIVPASDRGD